MEEKYIRIADIAELLGVKSKTTAYKIIQRYKINKISLTSKTVIYSRIEVLQKLALI